MNKGWVVFKDTIKIVNALSTEHQCNVFILIKDCFINYFKYRILGNSIRIDASNICQLQCPLCWQTQEKNKSFKKCHLKFDDFKKFIDNYPTFKNIELSDNGEIFLNPELKDIIRYAHGKRINLTARNGVNLNTASEEVLECLVKYKFRVMLVSIDGTTQDTYQIYRRGGNFDNVIENIKKINAFKYKCKSEFPRLIWQFILFGHNEHELPMAEKMAKKLNMKFLPMTNYVDKSYSPVKSCLRHQNNADSLYIFPCHQFWLAPQISPDGELLGCSNNSWRTTTYGNVFANGLERCLKNEAFIYTKNMLLGKKEPREDISCFHCRVYRRMRSRRINSAISFFEILKRFV